MSSKTDDWVEMDADEFLEDILPLLDPDEGDLLQVVYLRLGNGELLPFIGLPLSHEQFASIDGLGLGDQVQIGFEDISVAPTPRTYQ
jgi:hypothetical protein